MSVLWNTVLATARSSRKERRGIAAVQCYPGLELRVWNSARAAVGKLSANAQYGYYKA
jgi:hypothetical protein